MKAVHIGLGLAAFLTVFLAIVVAYDNYEVRLVDDTNITSGRVEVYFRGNWRTICDNNWDINNANVVCRQLDFLSASAYFGKGTGYTIPRAFDCLGNEMNLQDCPKLVDNEYCYAAQSAGVVCNQPGNYDVRLADGMVNSGRVEVYYEGSWRTVCDDYWYLNDANVLCRDLGFLSVESAPGSAYFGEGKGYILQSNFNCSGDEGALANCSSSYMYNNNCSHSQDAGAICNRKPVEYDVRLVDGKNSSEGRVEVFYNNTWQTVCSDYWDIRNAKVVCRQLGFTSAVSAPKGAYIGNETSSIFEKDIGCYGKETNIGLCSMWHRDGDCKLSDQAGAICTNPDDYEVRLFGDTYTFRGRVEVYHDGSWNTICDIYWDIYDANVVCRQLGFPSAASVPRSARFGEGTGSIINRVFRCSGYETKLQDCLRITENNYCYHWEDASVICNEPDDYEVRLVNGTNIASGRVEVYWYTGTDVSWNTICDDHWDINDANVVCRQLGFLPAASALRSAYFGEGTGSMIQTGFNCSGNETKLQDCPRITKNYCKHWENAGVICNKHDDYSVRLVDGTDTASGRVEVYHDGSWNTICHIHWDINDAYVVCRQLDFPSAASVPRLSYFGKGTGTIINTGFDCSGYETKLQDCPQVTPDFPCNHYGDVSVICNRPDDYEVRLVNGTDTASGRVEVYRNGSWNTICDDHWDINDANVVCRQLGFLPAASALRSAYFGEGTGSMIQRGFDCSGNETKLQDCPRITENYCEHWENAGVICIKPDNFDVRLTDGADISGRVEIFYEGIWRTVCDLQWDLTDANVVCQQLGFPSAEAARGWAFFGEGMGPIIIQAGFECFGNESSLADCPRSQAYMYGRTCLHSRDAGAICVRKPVEYDVRLVDGKSSSEGRVEVFYNNTWQTVCSDYWDMDNANVVCRQLGFTSAVSAPKRAYSGDGTSAVFGKDISCYGEKTNIGLCSMWQRDGDCKLSGQAGAVCTSPEYSIRLVNGAGSFEGRVEVFYDGIWQTICDYYWDIKDVTVVCRQLGFTSVVSAKTRAFGSGTGARFKNDVICDGSESRLSDCSMEPRDYCPYNRDSGIVCSSETSTEQYDVRLANGTNSLEGRVEVFKDGGWWTVCDDQWDVYDANVVCRQLGYGPAATSKTSAYFGQGTGSILNNDVDCHGFEETLHGCLMKRWTNCSDHSEDAGVVCRKPERNSVRLVGGNSSLEGRVEVYVNNTWGTICEDTWDTKDATVVCRQLGYEYANSIATTAEFGQGSGDIVYTSVSCSGSESTLAECYTSYNHRSCMHSEGAGVRCGTSAKEGDVRLVAGPDAYRGRVEIFMKDQWGTICADEWSLNEAEVVCKQLDYGVAANAGNSSYGSGNGLMMLYKVNCNGKERRLKDCINANDQNLPCSNYRNPAGVKCSRDALSTGTVIGIVIGTICGFVLVLLLLSMFLCGRHRKQPATHHVPIVSETTVPPQVHSVPQQDGLPSYRMVLAYDAYYTKVPTSGPVAEDPPPSYSLGPVENQNDSPSEHQYQTVQEPEDRRLTSNL